MTKPFLLTCTWSWATKIDLPAGTTLDQIETDHPSPEIDKVVCERLRDLAQEFNWKEMVVTDLQEADELEDENDTDLTERLRALNESKPILPQPETPKSGLDFVAAMEALKSGKKVCRDGWNDENMFLCLLPDQDGQPTKLVTGWPASQTDMLSTDWTILD